jgi:broad specificity phosphatase PhoE
LIDTIVREHRREKVLIVSHQVIVDCFRYLFERLDEDEILEIDRDADVPNCSVTSYEFDTSRGKNSKLVPGLVNFVAPLEQEGAAVTAVPDVPAAPKS